MILIVRTARSTLETTNETAMPPPLPLTPAGRLRQGQLRCASFVVPIHSAREADNAGDAVCAAALVAVSCPSLTPT